MEKAVPSSPVFSNKDMSLKEAGFGEAQPGPFPGG